MRNKISGLTLIEVLIALMILMAVLSTTALVVQSSRQNSAQAAAVIDLLRPLPLILQHVTSTFVVLLTSIGVFDNLV